MLCAAISSAIPRLSPCRKLVMMRHADSEESGEGRDHDRSITEAGRADAQQVSHCTAYRAPLLSAALRRDQYAVRSSVIK